MSEPIKPAWAEKYEREAIYLYAAAGMIDDILTTDPYGTMSDTFRISDHPDLNKLSEYEGEVSHWLEECYGQDRASDFDAFIAWGKEQTNKLHHACDDRVKYLRLRDQKPPVFAIDPPDELCREGFKLAVTLGLLPDTDEWNK